MELTMELKESANGHFQVIVFSAPGVVKEVIIKCNRSTLVAAMKKKGYAHLLPRGFASKK